VSKAIHEMDAQVRDRFKAMKVLYDNCQEFEDEQQNELRNIEVLYQELYKEVDSQRHEVLQGRGEISPEMIEAFDIKSK